MKLIVRDGLHSSICPSKSQSIVSKSVKVICPLKGIKRRHVEDIRRRAEFRKGIHNRLGDTSQKLRFIYSCSYRVILIYIANYSILFVFTS